MVVSVFEIRSCYATCGPLGAHPVVATLTDPANPTNPAVLGTTEEKPKGVNRQLELG